MNRFQIFPSSELYEKLVTKSNLLNISVSKLVIDLLSQIDIDNVLSSSTLNSYSFSSIYNDVKLGVEEFVKKYPTDTTFVLNELDVFKEINITKTDTGTLQPSSLRASVGRSFNAQVKSYKIPNVQRATIEDKNGNEVFAFKHNSAVYVIKK